MCRESETSVGILRSDVATPDERRLSVMWCSASLDGIATPQQSRLDMQYPIREGANIPGRSWKESIVRGEDGPILIERHGRKLVVWVGTVTGSGRREIVCGREPGSLLREEFALSDDAPEGALALPSAAALPDGRVIVSWLRYRSGHYWDLVYRDWSPDTGRQGSVAVAGTWELGPMLGNSRGSLTADGQVHTTVCGTREGKTGVWFVPLPLAR